MPALPSPGQVVRCDFRYANEDVSAENIFYFAYDGVGPITILELDSFIAGIVTDWNAPYVGAALGSCNGTEIHAVDLSSSVGSVVDFANTWAGTNMGLVIPASNSVVVSDTILRRYRGGHPRNYLMVGGAGDFLAGSIKMWQAAFLTNIQNGFNTFNGLFPRSDSGRHWTRVNVSFYETVAGVKTVRAVPLVDTIIDSVVKDRVSSQRRRLGKVGG